MNKCEYYAIGGWKKMNKKIIIIALVCILLLTIVGCQSWQRSIKDFGSSVTGLNRVVQVYSHDGNLIKEYEGRIDIEVNEYGNKVKFDLDGKRVIINNAIVITEEK